MNLVGDPAGLEELKLIKEQRKDFLKFLLTEVKTSVGRTTTFKGADGRHWRLTYNAASDELKIEPAG